MKDFGIQLAGGSLDVYEQDFAWTWRNIRFSEGLEDQYSTDIELPKTPNNMQILQISGLLDSATQLFGDKISPSVLTVAGDVTDAYLQVVEITEDAIKICLYERTFPGNMREKTIREVCRDDYTTIIAWNVNSLNAYPGWFRKYEYGMTYDHNYAQYHPVLPLTTVMAKVGQFCGLQIAAMPQNWWVMSTGKYLCPQNTKQSMEGVLTSDGFCIMGGGHVTNDLKFSYGTTSTNRIVFDRECDVNMQLWVSWKAKNNQANIPFIVTVLNGDNTTAATYTEQLRGDLYTNYVNERTIAMHLQAGQQLMFDVIGGSTMDTVRCYCELDITNYETTDEDYDKEMDYAARTPRLVVYNYTANSYQSWNADASTWQLTYKERGVAGTKHKFYDLPWASFAWFGYWANLKDIKLKDLFWGIAWLLGKKPVLMNGVLDYVPAEDTAQLDICRIESLQPSADLLGQTNTVSFDGQDNPRIVTEIPNLWLADEKALHKSPFGYIRNLTQFVGSTAQYSNPEYDADNQGYSCDFEDVGFLIWQTMTQQGGMTVQTDWIRDVPIQTFGLERITQVMCAKIKTADKNVKNVDYVYVSGKKFAVVEGNADLGEGITDITALLVP